MDDEILERPAADPALVKPSKGDDDIMERPSSYQPSADVIPEVKVTAKRTKSDTKPGNLFNFASKPEMQKSNEQIGKFAKLTATDVLPNVAQSVVNYPIELANLIKHNVLGQEPFPKLDVAPKTEAGRYGELIGDIGSYALPGKGLEAIGALPKVANPIGKFLLNLLGRTGEGAMFAAAKDPQNVLSSAATGGTIGGAAHVLPSLMANSNPLIGMGAKFGMGYLAGMPFGHGLTTGAIMSGMPVRSLLGIEPRMKVAEEMLSGIEPRDVARSIAANRRLGTSATPGEASGIYPVAGREGTLKRTVEGGRAGYRAEELQKYQQQNAIKSMLDKIYKPTPANNQNINNLYDASHRINLPDNQLNQIKQNPLWNQALNLAKDDPSLISSLQRKGLAYKNNKLNENNYHFLDEAKTKMDDMYQNAINSGDFRKAARIQLERELYLKQLDQFNPTYKMAREAAQPKLVREGIEKKFNQLDEGMTAKNFYSTFLNKRNSYQDLLRQLKNFPDAMSDIKDMRAGWKNFANMKTTSQSEAQGKTHLSDPRQMGDFIKNYVKHLTGGKGDVKRIEYIYGPDWEKDISRIATMKEAATRNQEMLKLLGRIGTAYGLSPNQSNNIMKLIRGSD